MTTRNAAGLTVVGFLFSALVVADQARAQTPTFRRPMRAREAPSPTPTHLPQRPVAARATTLDVLVSGSTGDGSQRWGKSLGLSSRQILTLGLTAASEYASALWEAADRPFEETGAAVVRAGHVADAAVPGGLLIFHIDLSEFLPPAPPEPPQEYFIRVTTLDADRNKVGTSNSLRLTYAKPGALVLPSEELAAPGESVRVSQSCDDSRTRVELCIADATSGWESPHCSSATFSCLPYSCHKGGRTCNSACLDDTDCTAPARCYHGADSPTIGRCIVLEARCISRTQIATPYETIDCLPYACKATDSGWPYCTWMCNSGTDCAHHDWCRADGRCGPPED